MVAWGCTNISLAFLQSARTAYCLLQCVNFVHRNWQEMQRRAALDQCLTFERSFSFIYLARILFEDRFSLIFLNRRKFCHFACRIEVCCLRLKRAQSFPFLLLSRCHVPGPFSLNDVSKGPIGINFQTHANEFQNPINSGLHAKHLVLLSMPPKRSTRVTVIDSEIESRSTTTRKTRVKRSRIKAEASVPAATADPSNGSSTKRTKRRKKAETAQTQAQPQARSSKTEMPLEQLLRSGNCTHLLVCHLPCLSVTQADISVHHQSKDLLSRLNRARTQKMFVISRETTGTYTQRFQCEYTLLKCTCIYILTNV